MPSELLKSLKGVGPWTVADIVNHMAANDRLLTSSNASLNAEVSQLRTDNQRLRDDITRYRDDAARLSTELRSLRESQASNAYNSDARRYDDGYRTSSAPVAARNWSDPYDRNYGYDRRY